ncbi:MAG: hypothetical protein ABEH78_01300 [Haloferacaceae archaeon]
MMRTNGEPRTITDRLSIDTIHDLLAKRRRRYTLYCLYLFANPMRLPDVADQVTEWEYGRPGEELLHERLRTYNDLYHSHVPKLDAVDVVEYSQAEDMIELAHNASRLRPYLEWEAETDLNATDTTPL